MIVHRNCCLSRPAKALLLGLIAVVGFFFGNAGTYADTIYVSNDSNSTIMEYGTNGVGTVFASSGLSEPVALAFDSAGNLYAANFNSGTIDKFNSSGGVLSSNGTVFASTYTPYGLAFDSSGNLYVASEFGNSIEKIDTNGVGTVFANSGLQFPLGIAVDSSGNLYVANEGSNTIVEFGTNGVGTVFASSGLNEPVALAFDRAGNLYADNFSSGTIDKFNSSGGVLSSNGTVFASMYAPWGLAFDSSGNLYGVSLLDSLIEEFDTNGVGTVFANSGMDHPFGIAIQVPEPSTWAMLAIGIGVVLGGLRLNRRSS